MEDRVMKELIFVGLMLMMAIIVSSCSSFNASIGVGYRKVPPEVKDPLIPRLGAAQLSPDQIQMILSLLGSEEFIKHVLPQNNRVDFGVWFDVIGKK